MINYVFETLEEESSRLINTVNRHNSPIYRVPNSAPIKSLVGAPSVLTLGLTIPLLVL